VSKSYGLLEGKVAIVTGAGSGIGKGIAQVFVREGAKVVVADFSGQQDGVAAELGSSALPCQADVSDEAEIEAMFRQAIDRFGKVDCLVNNAATLGGLLPEITGEEFDRMMAVNLRGLMLCCKHAVRAMRRNGGGSIINISSVGAFNTEERSSIAYAAAKAGVLSASKSLAVHHGAEGIRVNVLAPGFATTERQKDLPAEWKEQIARKSALGRISSVQEQAEVAAFLASDLSSFVTGAVIPVDGGWSARLV
jgi:NAD(P)-dependent dehydrogenase (short-subunit alcohol dehydrogenase family)